MRPNQRRPVLEQVRNLRKRMNKESRSFAIEYRYVGGDSFPMLKWKHEREPEWQVMRKKYTTASARDNAVSSLNKNKVGLFEYRAATGAVK